MFRVTNHTRTEKIGGDSILFLVILQVVAENRYDTAHLRKSLNYESTNFDLIGSLPNTCFSAHRFSMNYIQIFIMNKNVV